MSHDTSARLSVAAVLAVTLAACSNQSPAAPGELTAGEGGSLNAQGAPGVPGVYVLSFWAIVAGTYQYQEVSSLPVHGPELILRADVTDTSGNQTQLGSVTFEYCSYLKLPPNDITRADEAPKEACEQGLAKWARLASVSFGNCRAIGSGSACVDFGVVQIPRTVGFRFRYAQQKGTIASATSEARNFTWVAAAQ